MRWRSLGIMAVLVCLCLPWTLQAQPYPMAGGGMALPFHPSDVNRDHPIFLGMQHWWLVMPPLSGGSAWYDLIGQNHGTILNLTAPYGFRPSSRDGWAGQMQFQGDQSPDFAYTQVTTSGTSGITTQTMPFSVCLWAQVRVVRNVWSGLVVANGGTSLGIRFVWTASNQLDFEISDDAGNSIYVRYSGPVSLGPWHHLCATYDGSRNPVMGMLIYVDGVSQTVSVVGNVAGGVMTARPWVFGSNGGGSSSGLYAGACDSVMVWGRVVSPREVAFLAQDVLATSPLLQAPQPAGALVSAGAARRGNFLPFFQR